MSRAGGLTARRVGLLVLLALGSPVVLGCGTECSQTFTCDGFPVPNWVDGAGSTGDDRGADAAYDGVGNAIVVGSFGGPSVTIGGADGSGQTITLTGSGSGASLYAVKYAPEGGALWAITATSDGFARATAVAIDADNNVLVAGAFGDGVLQFTGLDPLAATAAAEVFVAKLSGTDGGTLWSVASQGDGSAEVRDLDVLGTSVFVAGSFSGALLLPSGVSLQSADTAVDGIGGDGFVAELSAAGETQAALSFGAEGEDAVTGVAVHDNGDIALCGYFNSATLPINASEPLVRSGETSNDDMWLASLSSLIPPEDPREASHVQWSLAGAGSGQERCLDIDVVPTEDGNATGEPDDLVITGYHTADVTLGTTTLAHAGSGQEELLVARLTGSAGAVQWVRSGLGTGSSRGTKVSAHSVQGVAVAASFEGAFQLGELSLPAEGASLRPLLISLDSTDGASRWLFPATGSHSDGCAGVTSPACDDSRRLAIANTAGRMLATGAFDSAQLSFCPQTAEDEPLCTLSTLSNAGGDDMFAVVIGE